LPSNAIFRSDPSILDSQDFLDTLADALGEDGILVVEIDDIFDISTMSSFIDGLEEADFKSIVEYDEGTGGAWSFFMAMKDTSSRANWIRNEAEITMEIRKRIVKTSSGGVPLTSFDGATMMSYQFPSRIVEESWCSQSGRCGKNYEQHGFDPWIENTPM